MSKKLQTRDETPQVTPVVLTSEQLLHVAGGTSVQDISPDTWAAIAEHDALPSKRPAAQ
jgi:hypothetical protein